MPRRVAPTPTGCATSQRVLSPLRVFHVITQFRRDHTDSDELQVRLSACSMRRSSHGSELSRMWEIERAQHTKKAGLRRSFVFEFSIRLDRSVER